MLLPPVPRYVSCHTCISSSHAFTFVLSSLTLCKLVVQWGGVVEGWAKFYKPCGDPLCPLFGAAWANARRLHGQCTQQEVILLWSRTLSVSHESPGSEPNFKSFWFPFAPEVCVTGAWLGFTIGGKERSIRLRVVKILWMFLKLNADLSKCFI